MEQNNQSNTASYEKILTDVSKKASVYRLSKTYPAYIVLVITIAISFLIKDFTTTNVESARKATFDKAVTSVMNRLESQYLNKVEVQSSMLGLYERSFVVRDVFELYGSIPVGTNPSILSINFVERVLEEEVPHFVFMMRSEGYYDIKLHPEVIDDTHYYIEYFVPLMSNLDRSGYDFASDSIMKEAIEKCMDSNMVVSTEIYNIRPPDTSGFYILAPVYERDKPFETLDERRENFKGVLVLELNSELFFEYALGNGTPSDSTIVFEFVDIHGDSSETKIYQSDNYSLLETGYQPYLRDVKDLVAADRIVKAKFATIPDFGGKIQNYLPMMSFFISLILSIIFFAFILSVTTSRARALDIAERMTRSQRRIVDSSMDIIAVMDSNGVWKSMNPAAAQIFYIPPENLIGQNIDTLFVDEAELKSFRDLINTDEPELTERVDYQMQRSDGDLRWINWSFTISNVDGNIYCIGRDVTLEKLAEKQAILRSKQMQLAERFTREASEFKTYFMTKLSHQIRNSLTGIIGYLQLLAAKVYETEEEHDSYLDFAEQSSEELFTFVSDIVDAATVSGDGEGVEISTIKFADTVRATEKIVKESLNESQHFIIEMSEESKTATLVADPRILSDTLTEVYTVLISQMDNCTIQINAQENPYEGATEIQLFATGNKTVEDMIEVFKKRKNNLIEALEEDKEDILLRLATVASNVRRMNGTLTVETFGSEEGNIIMITLPLQKKLE